MPSSPPPAARHGTTSERRLPLCWSTQECRRHVTDRRTRLMTDLYPMLIQPRYVERIWGGHTLAERLGKSAPRDQRIGESWEVYEENGVVNGVHAGRTIGDLRAELGRTMTGQVFPAGLLPLLIKLID